MTVCCVISWWGWATRQTAMSERIILSSLWPAEIMAILCLADDMKDLKDRLSRIVVAYNYAGRAGNGRTAEGSRRYGSSC